MPRLISFAKTWPQIMDRTKTETRRGNASGPGWKFVKVGDVLQPVSRSPRMGKPYARGPLIRITDTWQERLCEITRSSVGREGFSGSSPEDFVRMYGGIPSGPLSDRERAKLDHVRGWLVTALVFEYVVTMDDAAQFVREFLLRMVDGRCFVQPVLADELEINVVEDGDDGSWHWTAWTEHDDNGHTAGESMTGYVHPSGSIEGPY